jgi:5-oxoprolinase (ATP-hydrolysing) subunit A
VNPRGSIDLNADVGEGCGFDGELIPLVSSVNIACGAHAGDETTMREAVALALRHNVAIGAHPGFADRENFGRAEIAINPVAAAALVLGQTRILQGVAAGLGATVGHVKLHGALYNMAARDRALATAIVGALIEDTRNSGKERVLVALAGSVLAAVAREKGQRVVGEAFADRTYRRDGSLTPRSEPGAVITAPAAAARQAVRIAELGSVVAADGTEVLVEAETICLHGDNAASIGIARQIFSELALAQISIAPVRRSSAT